MLLLLAVFSPEELCDVSPAPLLVVPPFVAPPLAIPPLVIPPPAVPPLVALVDDIAVSASV